MMPPKLLSGLIALACTLASQEARTQDLPAAAPRQDQSIYLGRPVTQPERLSGIWESLDGHGGAVGLHLVLSTTAPADATTLVGATQSWLSLQVGIYLRSGAVLQPGEENWFSDSARWAAVTFEGNRLTIHGNSLQLDLTHTKEDRWSGRLHSKDFDSQVELTRPHPPAGTTPPWFLGTWRNGIPGHRTCLHLAQQASGGLTGWSDTLSAWGAERFAPGVARPPYSLEQYGDLLRVTPAANNAVTIERNVYSAGCCSHAFTATPTPDGKTMIVESPSGPNRSSSLSRWTRMPGNTCIADLH